jgi:hypothetical protein
VRRLPDEARTLTRWEKRRRAGVKALYADYRRAVDESGKPKLAADIDLYLGGGRAERPLVVFHHIRKTAGTAVRMLMHANRSDLEHAVRFLPHGTDRADWWRELYESEGERLAWVAGHHAAFLLEAVRDRPVEALSMVREPVDRALSRYHFLTTPDWDLDEFFATLETDPGAHADRVQTYCNAQALSLLEPHYDVRELPLSDADPAAELWRGRLLDLVERRYVLGVQEHFRKSVELFGRRLGWSYRRDHKVRVNRERAGKPAPAPRTRELIRRYNWLDEELHRFALRRFERRRIGLARTRH